MSEREKQISKSTDEPIWRAGIEMQTQRTDLQTQWGGRGWYKLRDQTETYTLTYVKQPVGICCMIQGAQAGAL